MPDTNPLLQHWTLPPWSAIRAEHLVPAINTIVAENRQIIAQVIASQTEQPNWDDLVVAIDEADARLGEALGVIETLSKVKSADADWLKESALCSLAAGQYIADKTANLELYRTYQRLAQSSVAASFDDQRKASLAKILRAFRLSGLDLPPVQQQELARINREIKALEQRFLSNLERANAAWSKRIDDVTQLRGLPEEMQARLARNARQAGHHGWLLTLDLNTCGQIMRHAQDRALREEYFTAWNNRASDLDPQADKLDNGPVLKELLALRHKKAELSGFENFVQLCLETRIATSAEQVDAFLRQQIASNTPALERDAHALKAFARTLGITDIQAWDEEFLAEQLRVEQSDGATRGLRRYFALDETLRRLCRFCEHLFGITIVEQTTISHWHEDVQLLEISEHGQVIGHIYVDPYRRQGTDDFAWTSVLRVRRINAEGRPALPIIILYSNFPTATPEHPCLLSHINLRVLVHEFGHCLHHVLTRSPNHNLSGISQLGRDSAEFAGELFEHWCMSPEFLVWLAAHYETGERLTHAQVNRALTALTAYTSRTTAMLLMSAMLDLQLHRCYGDGRGIEQVFEDVQREMPQLRMSGLHRFAYGFDYLVTGYEASVYAYKWSGAMATEVFKRFERAGVFDPQTGRDFRETFFAPGDSRSLLIALESFLGQPVDEQFLHPQPVRAPLTSD
ncbi:MULTISPECIES: M3 family metallopeptidase [unclassified Pseudomonas]|uniref:M3 family metallopeptidase n=1 Tax=unclassified Pseudomonas TaxID=196821 RepID=UPI001B32D551|nr:MULTISPECIES: M3 family metallopeptidase [unclassified Pseudomonas]MBP5943671.1 oligopeptidase A [Pseudomonas sp. P9(2020)]MBZ9563299.1 oligopeptidase A [Pseudomonas sp. P116]